METPLTLRRGAGLARCSCQAGARLCSGLLLLLPLIVVLFGLLAYPIITALGITLQDKMIGMPGRFIVLENYHRLLFKRPSGG